MGITERGVKERQREGGEEGEEGRVDPSSLPPPPRPEQSTQIEMDFGVIL